jgi:hypothetical protein
LLLLENRKTGQREWTDDGGVVYVERVIQGQRVRAAEVPSQLIGGDQQRDREQNTQCFHAVKFALSSFKKIGCQPVFMSVFG